MFDLKVLVLRSMTSISSNVKLFRDNMSASTHSMSKILAVAVGHEQMHSTTVSGLSYVRTLNVVVAISARMLVGKKPGTV